MTSINTLVMMTRAARQDIFSDANVDDSKLLQISPVRLSKISYQYCFGFCWLAETCTNFVYLLCNLFVCISVKR